MDGFLDAHAADAAGIRETFIPATDWTSPDMLALEKANMWPRVWQMACRVEEIPKVGDFVNYKIFDESILVTRTAQDKIQAFYNTCQHRGRRLRDEEKGHAGQWYCRFHGWKYNLDGSIAYVHDRDDWAACPLGTRRWASRTSGRCPGPAGSGSTRTRTPRRWRTIWAR
jgi:phenylpropionate dioxygenase-like ring-hydroxylating dioxygenase large terminal subunit